MYTIQLSSLFTHWVSALRDAKGKAAMMRRLDRAREGNLGDVKPLGDNLWEMRVDTGPGYRIYFTRQGERLLFLLCGGDKSTQERDIVLAKRMMKESAP